MTNKLYLDDSYLKQCEAVVLRCEAVQDGFDVVLDQTVLFATGGGQPHDTGRIADAVVLDVREEGDVVVHHTDRPLEVGSQVSVAIDWPRRFDHMQQHSGEHLLSFAAHDLFGAVNVGFHLASTYATIDLDIPLTLEQIAQLELHANRLVAKDAPITLAYVTAEEVETIALRKRASGLHGTIRLVLMQNSDSCTCCGTHCKHTGEIGLIHIISADKYKGGTRLTFVCGERAVRHIVQVQEIAQNVAKHFSTSVEEMPSAVERLQSEHNALKHKHKAVLTQLNRYVARELQQQAVDIKGIGLIVKHLEQLEPTQLKTLGQELTVSAKSVAVLFASDAKSLHYLLTCTKDIALDMGEVCQAVNAAFCGKGGGRGQLAQGTAPLPQALNETLEQVEHYLVNRLSTR